MTLLTKNYLSDLSYYLNELNKIIVKLPLEKKMYKEEVTVGQILFHTTQVVNYWFRVNMLEKIYQRDRESEFTKQPTLKQIKESMRLALDICEKLPGYKVPLDKKIKKTITVKPSNFAIDSANGILFHITIHTAEHYGELHLLVDK